MVHISMHNLPNNPIDKLETLFHKASAIKEDLAIDEDLEAPEPEVNKQISEQEFSTILDTVENIGLVDRTKR
jgi:hypothetical protein